jgi:hypothetical protein
MLPLLWAAYISGAGRDGRFLPVDIIRERFFLKNHHGARTRLKSSSRLLFLRTISEAMT